MNNILADFEKNNLDSQNFLGRKRIISTPTKNNHNEDINKIHNFHQNYERKISCYSQYSICIHCKGLFPYNYLSIHEKICLFKNNDFKQLLENFHKNQELHKKDYKKCIICQYFLPSEKLYNHVMLCLEKMDMNREINLDINSANFKYVEENEVIDIINNGDIPEAKEEKIQCGFCLNQINKKIFDDHIQKCQLNEELNYYLLKKYCEVCGIEILDSEYNQHLKNCREINNKKEKIDQFLAEFCLNQYKSTANISEYIKIHDLDEKTDEYKMVKNMAEVPNYRLISIQVIENLFIWKKYFDARNFVSGKNVKRSEKLLFHGTKYNDPKDIIRNGFDISFARNKSSLGRGLYFAKDVNYSVPHYCYHDSSGNLNVFLCKVIAVNSKNLDEGDKLRAIDSTIFDENYECIENKNMVVLTHNEKAYPFYLLKYRI